MARLTLAEIADRLTGSLPAGDWRAVTREAGMYLDRMELGTKAQVAAAERLKVRERAMELALQLPWGDDWVSSEVVLVAARIERYLLGVRGPGRPKGPKVKGRKKAGK